MNNFKIKGTVVFSFIIVAAALGFQNCSSNEFSTPVDFAQTDGTFNSDLNIGTTTPITPGTVCQDTIQTVTTPIKVAFLVDVSGSNNYGASLNPGTGTDPSKNFRYGRISEFVNLNRTRPDTSWQFVTFGGTTATIRISPPSFTPDISLVDQALTNFRNIVDAGGTPYRASFNALMNLVRNDPQFIENSPVSYAAVLVSDGAPSDYPNNMVTCKANGTNCGPVDLEKIKTDVMEMVAFSKGHLSISTVYYGPVDAAATAVLKTIADNGNGGFVDLNESTSQIDLKNVVKISVPCKH